MSQTKQSKPTGTDSPFKFEGESRDFNQGGNKVAGVDEKHDGPYASGGKKNGQDYAISKCIKSSTDSVLEQSKVSGTKKCEIGPAEAVRRANNHARDGRTNLGTGKPSEVVTD